MAASPPSPGPAKRRSLRDLFVGFSKVTASIVGSVWAFIFAILIIVLWGLSGPLFNYSDTWQLIINTGTTVVTFLMVFLIQSTQNRDAKAIHLKLDELVRALEGARNNFVDLESLSEEELERLAGEFTQLREKACSVRERRSHRAQRLRTIEEEADEVIVEPKI